MIAAFPIGWTVSRLMIAIVFYLVITPIASVFRLVGRDLLKRRRRDTPSYWSRKSTPTDAATYLRQS